MPWVTKDVSRFKKNLSDRDKERWVRIANSVLQRCLAEGGSQSTCEASAIRQASGSVGNNINIFAFSIDNYEIRYETHQGREHIIVPVVMMVDGVHHGSAGPLLHTSEEYGKYPAAWNGIPIAVMHPEEDGTYISANSPQIIDSQTIGRIYNTSCNGKLKAECWIDVKKAEEVYPEILEDIRNGKPIQVSIGVFTDDEADPGTWDGEDYSAIARNHRPDHLALLPGGQGACSWDDGCGIRANQEGGEEVKKEDGTGEKEVKTQQTTKLANKEENEWDVDKLMKRLSSEGFAVIQINDQGFKEICSKIQSKLDAMDTDVKAHYLEDVWGEHFIYKVRTQGNVGQEGGGLYQRDYQVNDDESIEFTGEPVAVVMKKEYQTLQANTEKGGMENMSKEKKEKQEKKPCCPEQVNTIIQSNHTRFEESDREWLEGLEEGNLIKLLPVEPEGDGDVQTDVQANTDAQTGTEPAVVTKERAIEVLKEQLSTPEQFLELMPKDIKNQLQYGLQLHETKRKETIRQITANTKVFSNEELKTKSTDELIKLAKAVAPQADYSAQSGGGVTESKTNVVQPLGVPGMEISN